MDWDLNAGEEIIALIKFLSKGRWAEGIIWRHHFYIRTLTYERGKYRLGVLLFNSKGGRVHGNPRKGLYTHFFVGEFLRKGKHVQTVTLAGGVRNVEVIHGY